eukprot:9486157-Pyramimonas_sp.AAC.1
MTVTLGWTGLQALRNVHEATRTSTSEPTAAPSLSQAEVLSKFGVGEVKLQQKFDVYRSCYKGFM